MSDRPRTGEVEPIPAPDERPGASARVRPASAGFDFGDIDAAIGDLTADVQPGAIEAVELPPALPVPRPAEAHARLAALEAGFGVTDEHDAVESPSPYAVTGDHGDSAPAPPGPPAALSAPPPPAWAATPPPQARPVSAPVAPPVAPPMARPVAGPPGSPPPPARRPIQNVETAYVKNPLMGPRPRSAAPAPGLPSAPPAEQPTDPFAPTEGQPAVDQPPRGRLVVHGGDWNGTTWYLNRAETRLGRGEENDIVVLDIGVSRQHIVFARHGEGFRLIDLQSGNGTYVNGRRVAEAELYDGDRIDLGHTTLVFGTLGPPRHRRPGSGDYGQGVGRQLPTTWLVAMALTTFFTVLGTMYLVRTLRGGGGDEVAVAEAVAAVADRRWEAARAAVEQARAEGADEEELAALSGRIEAGVAAAAVIERATAALEGGATPEEIEALVAEVPPASPYAGDARGLVQRAKQQQVKTTLDDAERLLAEKKTAAARVKVEGVLGEDAGNVRARALLKRIEALE